VVELLNVLDVLDVLNLLNVLSLFGVLDLIGVLDLLNVVLLNPLENHGVVVARATAVRDVGPVTNA
jgi:hypothetical protein